MDALSRTTSNDSAHSQKSHHLSASTGGTRKGRHATTETTSAHVDRASISMPPPTSKPNLRYQNLGQVSSRVPSSSNTAAMGGQDEVISAMSPRRSDEASHAGEQSQELRKPEPGLESNRMSFSSLYNFMGKSGPSSVGSDQDGVRTDVSVNADSADGQAAQHETRDRATTATQPLSITTQSQNGALSPSALKENPLAAPLSTAASSTVSPNSPSASPTPQAREPRSTRGRTTAASRRVSNSNTNSASASSERPPVKEKPKIGYIGICALDSKARSKPSRNILNRLVGNDNDFEVIMFGDKVILDESVENWPMCDFLISFFSDGFPLHKAIAYAKLRKPFCVNDLPMQTVLWDRRLCLKILDKLGVPTPPRIEVNRDGGSTVESPDIAQRLHQLTGVKLIGTDDGRGGGEEPPIDIHLEDDDDTLVVDGQRLTKPFVEKPTHGEDHNINIYYPKSQGGGGRRLFRKINNKSSEKDETLTVPRAITEKDQSYIYEQFLKVENAEDVKAYTVGPDYCHAETRKSPVVDGIVKRNPNGKEIRYITPLSKEEQVMAAKISHGFGQRVCGFDLLRVEDSSYVIDVNGWSFVKDNNEYYDKCAGILKGMFLREKMRKDGLSTPTEELDRELMPPPNHPTDKTSHNRKPTPAGKERETARHRDALKSVLHSRSISQLREHVTHAASKVGHPHGTRSPSGTTSPLTSPPSFERPAHAQSRKTQTIPLGKDDVLPTPATSTPAEHLSAIDDARYAASDHQIATQPTQDIEPPPNVPAPASKSQWKLKGMVAVIRHADRTPKQKFKFTFHTKPFVDLLKGHQEEVLLVGEAALHSVQLAVKQAIDEGVEDMQKLRVLQNALAKKGAWPGTKVQIKPMFKKPKKDKDGEKDKIKDKISDGDANTKKIAEPADTFPTAGTVEQEDLERWKKQVDGQPKPFPKDDSGGPEQVRAQTRSDSLSEVTLSRVAAKDDNLVLDKLQLVMKWGGEPTHSARYQAADLGENIRNDLLLMNRNVLSNVSVFTSSERRVTTSAQIFAAAFLGEKDADPGRIRVRKDLLDDSNAAKDEMDKVKKKLKGLLREGTPAPEGFAWPPSAPEPYIYVRKVVELMKFHRRVMRHNFSKLQTSDAMTSLEKIKHPPTPGGSTALPATEASGVQARWCTGEDAELFKERWEKLFNEFVDAEKVDPSKISELYDTMKFDALHNRQFLEWVFTPSQSLLLAEAEEAGEAAHGSRLVRTESVVAREEFAQTHEKEGEQPNSDAKGEHEGAVADPGNLKPPPRTGTTSSVSSTGNDKEAPRQSLSQRMGFRRRSADLMSVAKNLTGVQDIEVVRSEDPSQSYFNLDRGNMPAGDSKVKTDIRLEKLNELYSTSKVLFDFIGPQEYGITDAEKLEIGLLTSLPLLKEIVKDLEEVQASDDAKSFIYFTKESHIYTLLNCILEGGVQTKIARQNIPELDYLSQICFELYESENAEQDINPLDPDGAFNYSIRITISPGCHTSDPLDVLLDSKHCIGCSPRRSLTPHGEWREVLETLRAKFHTVKLPKSFTAVNLSERMPEVFNQQAGDEAAEEGSGDAGQEVAVESPAVE